MRSVLKRFTLVFFAPIVFIGLLLSASCEANSFEQPTVIEIDTNISHQVMSGWEATLGLPDGGQREPNINEIHERAVNEIGLNRVRLEIRSGAEHPSFKAIDFITQEIDYETWKSRRYEVINDNDDPFLINWDGFDFSELNWQIENNLTPLRELLEARGEALIVNLCYVSFRPGDYVHKNPDEYAEFVLATYQYLDETHGFVPDSWEVILEPDLKPDMWNGEEIGLAMVATAERLQEAGYEPSFVVPSVTNMKNAPRYINEIARIPGAIDHVREFSYHRYRGANRKNLRKIVNLAERHNKSTSMLEWWFGRGDHNVLHEDLKLGRVSSWQGRVLNGHFRTDEDGASGALIQLQPEVRYNLQYFKHVRNGAVRVEATSSRKSLDPLAFINPDHSATLIVKSEVDSDVEVYGLPPGRYEVSYALKQKSVVLEDTLLVKQSGSLKTRMPGPGVLTISSFRLEN